MAKAKKPSSGNKGDPKSPAKTASEAVKPVADAQASAAKPDSFVSKRPDAEASASKAAGKSTAKPAEPKKPEVAAAKSQTPSVSEPKSKAAEAASSSPKATPPKTEPAKAEVAKAQPAPVVSTPKEQPIQQQEEPQGSGFFPLVIGGLIAGSIGFGASHFGYLNAQPEPQAAFDASGIETSIATQQDQMTALETTLQEVAAREPAAAADLSGIETEIASTSEALAAVSETVAAIETRLSALENQPAPIADDGTATAEAIEAAAAQAAEKYTEELAALQASVEDQKSEIARLLENALSVEEATANAAKQATVMGALTKITTAMNSGEGFSGAIDELTESGIDDIPAALTDAAADGVPTLLTLQSDFPDTARAALSTARASGTDEGESGLGGFLKRQLGARSVVPRGGSDPDAVLSRAEAAVRNGNIADALSEIDTLPADAQDAMAQWRTSAQTRADVAAAVEDLSQRLTAN